MYKLIEYSNEYRLRWNEFVKTNGGTIFHLIEWKDILEEAFGYRGLYHLVLDGREEIVGIMPLVAGRDLLLRKVGASLPFVNYIDICCSSEDVFSYIIDQVEKLPARYGLKHIEIRLKEQAVNKQGLSLNDTNYTLILPLDGDEEKVLSYSTSSNRNHTRKSYKNNYFTSCFGINKLPEFYEIYCRTMKRLGSPAPDYKFFKLITDKLGEYTTLLTVSDNETGRVIGGMFLFSFGDTLYYPWGGSLAEYNKKYVNNFMYWEAAKCGISKGYKYLDLGRSPFESGTYKFKLQWGAVPFQLRYYRFGSGAEGTEIDRDKLGLFVSLWKVMPGFITDFAGKILIKYVQP